MCDRCPGGRRICSGRTCNASGVYLVYKEWYSTSRSMALLPTLPWEAPTQGPNQRLIALVLSTIEPSTSSTVSAQKQAWGHAVSVPHDSVHRNSGARFVSLPKPRSDRFLLKLPLLFWSTFPLRSPKQSVKPVVLRHALPRRLKTSHSSIFWLL